MVKLSGISVINGNEREVGLETLFPDYPDGVFAHWVTGELRCPSGALLKYVHGGFGSLYKIDQFFRVQRGVVLERRAAINGQGEPGASRSYQISAKTTFGKKKQD